jgi:hypothetical protein
MGIDNESVSYDIRIEAVLALKNLADLTNATSTFNQKIHETSLFVRDVAKQWGVPFQQAKSELQSLDKALSKTTASSTVFGNRGQEAWNMVGDGALKAEQQVNQSANRMGSSFAAIRIALGILVSMLIHNVIQAVQNAFGTMIHNLRETELAVYNLINAERRLSEEGIDVTPKGLQETIDAVQKLVPVLSKIQSEELVSRIASNVAPSLKLTNEQIRQMAESVAILYIRNKALGKSFDEVESQLTNAFLTGRVSQGINNLGVKLSDQIVRDEALRLGLVQTEEEFDNLTGEMEAQIKASAMLSVVYKNATQDVESLGSYMMTTDEAIESSNTAWNNLLTTLGTKFGPVLIEVFTAIAERLIKINEWLEKNEQKAINFVAIISGAVRAFAVLNDTKFSDRLFSPFEVMTQVMDAFKGGVADALKGSQDLASAVDTPTAAIDGLQDSVDNFDASNLLDEVQDVLDKTREAQEDLDIEFGRKTMDLDVEYDRKGADAYLDYQRKVEDINRETEDEIADIKQKRREEDAKREAEYQNKLWELQQKYLMDLEDALHNRDARQIIRLQRQYAFEKEALERKNALDAQESKLEEKGDIKKARDDQKDKLEDAAIDYQRKLADLNTAKAREQEDLQKWYDREQDDLQLDQDRKLQALTEGWVEAGLLTEENAAYIYSILAGYFGPGGLTDQIYAYMRASLAQAMAMAGGIALPVGQPAPYSQLAAQSTPASAGTATPIQQLTSGGYESNQPYTPTFVPRPGGYAEGGAFMATTPQSIKVGERGAEMVQTTPIGRVGNDVNKFFMGAGGEGENTRGEVEIGLTLSPDLEARIIRQSMDATANVVLKVNRTRA